MKRKKKSLYDDLMRPMTQQEQLTAAKRTAKANFKQWMFCEERHSKTLDLLSAAVYWWKRRVRGEPGNTASVLAEAETYEKAHEHLRTALRGEPRPE